MIEPANVYPLDDETATKTIELRRNINIKLADAVIAATAILNDLILAFRNVKDYKGIKELKVVNPFDLKTRGRY